MNPLLKLIAPLLSAPVADLKAALSSLVATPTLENLTAQGEKLALDALNPSALGGLSIQTVAQEALNVITSLESHLTTAVANPTVATAS